MGLYGSKDQHPKLVATSSENEHLASLKWQYCEKCGNKHLQQYKKCPACGHSRGKIGTLGRVWIFLFIIITCVVIFVYNGVDVSDSEYQPNKRSYVATKANTPPRTVTETVPEFVETTASMTMGQKNALRAAKQYLSFANFSYDGLIKQLEFEKYTHDDATFAADNCGADWYEQAAKSAKQYLDIMAFSKNGLIDQLIFEGFTEDQANYAVKMNGYE